MQSCRSQPNLIGLSDCDVLLDPERPVDVEDVFVEREHEHDQHEQRVEHCEIEHCHVAQLFEALLDFFLQKKEVRKVLTSCVSSIMVAFSTTPKGHSM